MQVIIEVFALGLLMGAGVSWAFCFTYWADGRQRECEIDHYPDEEDLREEAARTWLV